MIIGEIINRVENDENFIMLMIDSDNYRLKKGNRDFIIYKDGRGALGGIFILNKNNIVVSRRYESVYRGYDVDKAVRYLLGIIREELSCIE